MGAGILAPMGMDELDRVELAMDTTEGLRIAAFGGGAIDGGLRGAV